MSEIKVNKISPKQTCTQLTLGDSGDTIIIPAGATITNNGTATGFGRTGAVNWDTTPKTTTVTAVSGTGYFVDTTSGAVTVNLPAGVAGSIVAISDYANTSATNNIIIDPNGTDKINGVNQDAKITTNGAAITLVYVDATRGWKDVNDATLDLTGIPPFVAATGGTVLTCGNFKTHVFTGPGTFTVTNAGTPAGSTTLDYLVVAGGGGTFRNYSAGGGAGGFRISNSYGLPAPTMSPLSTPTGITATATSYPITVGAGGAGGPPAASGGATSGSVSIFSTITSTGGGKGGSSGSACGSTDVAGTPGGSGGGGDYNVSSTSGGTGNTPPVSPPQGNSGGTGGIASPANFGAGGGGGAGALGNSWPSVANGGIGSFVANTFLGPTSPSYGESGPVGSTRYFSGGGGSFAGPLGPTTGGIGGGGDSGLSNPGVVNTGGGGGAGPLVSGAGGAGGSGIVLIRYRYQ